MTSHSRITHGPGTSLRFSRARYLAMAGMLAVASTVGSLSIINAQDSTPDPASTPVATPSAAAPRLELELEELNDSGIDGTVTLYGRDDHTIVEIEVDGAGDDHPAYISSGVCGDLDPNPVQTLAMVDGSGEARSLINISLDELLAEPHAVEMRLAPDNLGTMIACANIEGTPTVGGTPEATPSATPSEDATATPGADGTGGSVSIPTATSTSTESAISTSTATATTPTATTVPGTTPEATADTSDSQDGTGGVTTATDATVTVRMETLYDSGVTGEAVLTDNGASTIVTLELEGEAIVGDHTAHLHTGTCGAPGDETYELNPIDADGRSVTGVPLTLSQIESGGYMINVHPSDENWDAWMVCANIGTTTTAGTTSGPTYTVGGDGTGGSVSVGGPTASGSVATSGTGVVSSSVVYPTALPQNTGTGSSIPWPDSPRNAILWAVSASTVILAAGGIVVRRGETSTSITPRWTRLGL